MPPFFEIAAPMSIPNRNQPARWAKADCTINKAITNPKSFFICLISLEKSQKRIQKSLKPQASQLS